MAASERGLIGSALMSVFDFVVPHRCCSCGVAVNEPDALCHRCFGQVRFITGPRCESCSIPLREGGSHVQHCASCLAAKPLWRRARSLVVYDDGSRQMLLSYKHARRYSVARSFANWMGQHAFDIIHKSDVIVPVPLHLFRLAGRRFNQSALIAKHLAKDSTSTYLPDSLVKVRSSPSQQGMTAKQRSGNVSAKLFRVPKRRNANIYGKKVLLVDDVLTTGATVRACTRCLLSAGAAHVDLVTVARSERPTALNG